MRYEFQPDHTNESANLDRPLWGAAAIGAEINRTERQAHYMLERGLLPAEKVGKSGSPRRAVCAIAC